MTDLRDGFLYHPESVATTAQLERLLAGEHNTAFDDPFGAAVQEAEQELRDEEEKERKTLERLDLIRAKIERLKAHKVEVEKAVHHFLDTGKIEDVLLPACRELISNEWRAFAEADAPTKEQEIKDASDALSHQLGDDWKISETKADDKFVYVTIKRLRAVAAPERPYADEIVARVTEKVRAAFKTYRLDFKTRARPLRLLAIPTNPRASP